MGGAVGANVVAANVVMVRVVVVVVVVTFTHTPATSQGGPAKPKAGKRATARTIRIIVLWSYDGVQD